MTTMTAEGLDILASSSALGPIILKNRVIKSATFEGKTPNGHPTKALIDFHTEIARGGVAMTTVGCCNVSVDARNLDNQMYIHTDLHHGLKELCDEVHRAGAKISAQLTHCGFFKQNKPQSTRFTLAPSFQFNKLGAPNGRPFAISMSQKQIQSLLGDYCGAAEVAVKAGFDCVEIQMGHGYLLNQFLSPDHNRRRDQYGGSAENRMRLPLSIVKGVKKAVGNNAAVIAKINLDDAAKNGLRIEDYLGIGRRLEDAGIDAIVTSGGRSSGDTSFMFRGDSPIPAMARLQKNPISKIALKLFGHMQYRATPYHELYFMELAKKLRSVVDCPLVYLGGVSSPASAIEAMKEGFEFVAMGRALIKDPNFMNNLLQNSDYTNGCTHCNQCVALVYSPQGVHCVLNQSTKCAV